MNTIIIEHNVTSSAISSKLHYKLLNNLSYNQYTYNHDLISKALSLIDTTFIRSIYGDTIYAIEDDNYVFSLMNTYGFPTIELTQANGQS